VEDKANQSHTEHPDSRCNIAGTVKQTCRDTEQTTHIAVSLVLQ